ncbi:hypothetical protein [Paracoccus limosus]|uniref:hypothetical protein n=1 Tax=Paracoccus limosus TaxID=913252 RepID=UPI001FE997B7|nr:hypothetical protein [Paracoccus limosus]
MRLAIAGLIWQRRAGLRLPLLRLARLGLILPGLTLLRLALGGLALLRLILLGLVLLILRARRLAVLGARRQGVIGARRGVRTLALFHLAFQLGGIRRRVARFLYLATGRLGLVDRRVLARRHRVAQAVALAVLRARRIGLPVRLLGLSGTCRRLRLTVLAGLRLSAHVLLRLALLVLHLRLSPLRRRFDTRLGLLLALGLRALLPFGLLAVLLLPFWLLARGLLPVLLLPLWLLTLGLLAAGRLLLPLRRFGLRLAGLTGVGLFLLLARGRGLTLLRLGLLLSGLRLWLLARLCLFLWLPLFLLLLFLFFALLLLQQKLLDIRAILHLCRSDLRQDQRNAGHDGGGGLEDATHFGSFSDGRGNMLVS